MSDFNPVPMAPNSQGDVFDPGNSKDRLPEREATQRCVGVGTSRNAFYDAGSSAGWLMKRNLEIAIILSMATLIMCFGLLLR